MPHRLLLISGEVNHQAKNERVDEVKHVVEELEAPREENGRTKNAAQHFEEMWSRRTAGDFHLGLVFTAADNRCRLIGIP